MALDLQTKILFEFGRDFEEIFTNFDSLSGEWYAESESKFANGNMKSRQKSKILWG